MSGIRLHATDPLLRAGEGATTTFVVETPLEFTLTKPGGRDRGNEPCQRCGTPHRRKAIHLDLDSNGDTIVAPQVFEELVKVPGMFGDGGKFEATNEVPEPPAKLIGAVAQDKARIIAMPLNGQAPATKITPGATKYEGEARIWLPFKPVMDAERERLDRIETAALAEKRRIFTSKPKKPKKKG